VRRQRCALRLLTLLVRRRLRLQLLELAPLDAVTRNDLLELIDDRGSTRGILITAQLPVEHWHAWIGDPTIADAILDRLMHRIHRITLAGELLRKSAQKIGITPKADDAA
jgi:IstB-like ATP binding protein